MGNLTFFGFVLTFFQGYSTLTMYHEQDRESTMITKALP